MVFASGIQPELDLTWEDWLRQYLEQNHTVYTNRQAEQDKQFSQFGHLRVRFLQRNLQSAWVIYRRATADS
jgi:hypothetical protein